jgi:hypothetical protein
MRDDATSPPKHQDLALHLARAPLQRATSSASWPNEGRLTTARCPDRILSAQLCGTALRRAAARVPVDVAVEELRGMANGRGQPAGRTGRADDRRDLGATGDSEYLPRSDLLIAASAGEDQPAGRVQDDR